MTVRAGSLLPREHINSCDQATWTAKQSFQINGGMYFNGQIPGSPLNLFPLWEYTSQGRQEATGLPRFGGNSVICNICVNIMEVLGSSVHFKRRRGSAAFGSDGSEPARCKAGFGKTLKEKKIKNTNKTLSLINCSK